MMIDSATGRPLMPHDLAGCMQLGLPGHAPAWAAAAAAPADDVVVDHKCGTQAPRPCTSRADGHVPFDGQHGRMPTGQRTDLAPPSTSWDAVARSCASPQVALAGASEVHRVAAAAHASASLGAERLLRARHAVGIKVPRSPGQDTGHIGKSPSVQPEAHLSSALHDPDVASRAGSTDAHMPEEISATTLPRQHPQLRLISESRSRDRNISGSQVSGVHQLPSSSPRSVHVRVCLLGSCTRPRASPLARRSVHGSSTPREVRELALHFC